MLSDWDYVARLNIFKLIELRYFLRGWKLHFHVFCVVSLSVNSQLVMEFDFATVDRKFAHGHLAIPVELQGDPPTIIPRSLYLPTSIHLPTCNFPYVLKAKKIHDKSYHSLMPRFICPKHTIWSRPCASSSTQKTGKKWKLSSIVVQSWERIDVDLPVIWQIIGPGRTSSAG